MSVTSSELLEFYRQLALLVKADMPLPESLASLARECQSRQLKRTLEALAADTAAGKPLATALDGCPGAFPAFHRQLIAAGEKAGTLAETLHEVAQFARFNHQLVERVREAVAYPVFVVLVAVAVLTGLLYFLAGGAAAAYVEFYDGETLPLGTRILFTLAGAVHAVWPALLALYLLVLAALGWLFSERAAAQFLFRRCVTGLPGCASILEMLDHARLCSMLATLIERQAPLPDAFGLMADMSETPVLCDGLRQTQKSIRSGVSLAESLRSSQALPDPVRLILVHCAESQLPRELAALRDAYVEQLGRAARRLAAGWEIGGAVLLGAAVGGVILTLYLPLIQLLHALTRVN